MSAERLTTEAGVYDTRALTDDQRSLADDIASGMGWGHEEVCQVWSEDPDGCSCPLLQAVADGLNDAGVIAVIQEQGYDSATRRGDRLVHRSFRPHPLSLPAEPTAPTLDFDSASALLSAYNYWLHDHPDASVGDRYDWTKRYLARLAAEPNGADR